MHFNGELRRTICSDIFAWWGEDWRKQQEKERG